MEKQRQRYIIALENKKKKNPFRRKSETELAHVQSFTDFNQKKKKASKKYIRALENKKKK